MAIPDCPICLCPLSNPWGTTSCGHPYHKECWDEVVAAAKRDGKGATPKCSICKGTAKAFSVVYVDLEDVDNEADEIGDHAANDEEVEKLKSEYEDIYQELKLLLAFDCEDGIEAGKKRQAVGADDFQGTQDMRDICATIDLTQSPSRFAEKTDSDETEDEPDVSKMQKDNLQQQQRQSIIQQLLKRMHEIHTTLLDLTPSSKSQLKSKFLSLKRTTADLQSQIDILSGETNTLQSKLNRAQQSLFDRNIETEREKRLHQDMNHQYTHLLEVHSAHQNKTKREIDALKETNAKLKKECEQLRTVSGLADMQEMEEITEKYRKMSQQLHDVMSENRTLKRRMEERERRRGEMERIREEVRRVDGKVAKEIVRRVSDEYPADDRGTSGYRSRKPDNSSSSSSKAMDILNSAPSRKSVPKKSAAFHPKKGLSRPSNLLNKQQAKDIGRWDYDEEDKSDSEQIDVQLFMKPNPSKKQSRSNIRPSTNHAPNPIPFQRYDSVSSVSSTVGTKRMLKESASLSRKSAKHGQTISSFFKPVADK